MFIVILNNFCKNINSRRVNIITVLTILQYFLILDKFLDSLSPIFEIGIIDISRNEIIHFSMINEANKYLQSFVSFINPII